MEPPVFPNDGADQSQHGISKIELIVVVETTAMNRTRLSNFVRGRILATIFPLYARK